MMKVNILNEFQQENGHFYLAILSLSKTKNGMYSLRNLSKKMMRL